MEYCPVHCMKCKATSKWKRDLPGNRSPTNTCAKTLVMGSLRLLANHVGGSGEIR